MFGARPIVVQSLTHSQASAIMVFLAENLYNSSYPSSHSSNGKKPEDADPTDVIHTAPNK